MSATPVRVGVCGLGRAFVLTLPALLADARVTVVGACEPRAQSRDAFRAQFPAAFVTDDIDALCERSDIDLIYIATPHPMHADHAVCAAQAGKHILVEKPMAVSLRDAQRMRDAAIAAGVQLIVGPAHSFDEPVAIADRLLGTDALGPAHMIQSLNYTDFLYRPRRPEELQTQHGGGVVFSQAAHQIDVVRRYRQTESSRNTHLRWSVAHPSCRCARTPKSRRARRDV